MSGRFVGITFLSNIPCATPGNIVQYRPDVPASNFLRCPCPHKYTIPRPSTSAWWTLTLDPVALLSQLRFLWWLVIGMRHPRPPVLELRLGKFRLSYILLLALSAPLWAKADGRAMPVYIRAGFRTVWGNCLPGRLAEDEKRGHRLP